MNNTTAPPAITDGDVAVGYVLVPFFLFTVIGIVVAVVSLCDTFKVKSTGIDVNIPSFFLFQIMYIRKRKRYDVQSRQGVFYSIVYWLIKMFFCCFSESTDFAISFCQFTHMILQRNSTKPSKKCYGEKRTRGYDSTSLDCFQGSGVWHNQFVYSYIQKRSRLLSFFSLRNYLI